jgi:hypothetical protein
VAANLFGQRSRHAAGRRVYRSPSTIRGAIIATAGLIGVGVLAALPGRGQIVGFIFLAPWLVGTWRSWTLGVHVEADGVKVVGLVLSKRIRWEDIDHFAVLPAGNYPYVGQIIRRDGGPPMPVLGLAAGRGERFRPGVQKPVDELNLVLAEVREANRDEHDEPQDGSLSD